MWDFLKRNYVISKKLAEGYDIIYCYEDIKEMQFRKNDEIIIVNSQNINEHL